MTDSRKGLPPGAANEPELEEEERDDAIIGKAVRITVIILAVGAVVVGIGGWLVWKFGQEPAVVQAPAAPPELPEVREIPEVVLPQIPFADITDESGIDFVQENGAAGEKLLPETMGTGCAFLDYDGDGDEDILLVNARRWPWDDRPAPEHTPAMTLWKNDGTGHYADATAESGLGVSLYGQGCAVGDFDNDNDPDLFISAVAPVEQSDPPSATGPHRLFRNDGGHFVDVTQESGVAGEPHDWGTSCGWFDYDNDGDLDLWVCRYVVWSRAIDLAQDFRLTGGQRAYGRPQGFTGQFPLLYRNDGDAGFTDVSEAAGLHVQEPASGAPLAKSLGVAFCDFDWDGRLDVIVANDTVQNLLFHNQGNGTFEESAAASGVAFDNEGKVRGAMGIDAACCRNGDDSFAVAIGNFSNEMSAFYVTRPRTLQFTDEAIANGLGPNTRLVLTFSVMFLDADLDGRLDYFQTNGHLEDEIAKVQASQTYEQPPQLFWNAGSESDLEFIPLKSAELGEDFLQPIVGRAAAYADIDADGDLDLLVTTVAGKPRLLRNDQSLSNHWLRLRLVGNGTTSNRDAIGARIVLRAGGEAQTRIVTPTRGYLSQSELTATFGLGDVDAVESVEITWPDGTVETMTEPAVDQLHVVTQSGAQ